MSTFQRFNAHLVKLSFNLLDHLRVNFCHGFIKLITLKSLVITRLLLFLILRISSEIHPVEGHILIIEKSFFYLLAIFIHWVSDQVEISRDLLVMSTILENIYSIAKTLNLIFINKWNQILPKKSHYIRITYHFLIIFKRFICIKSFLASTLFQISIKLPLFIVAFKLSQNMLSLHFKFLFILVLNLSFERCPSFFSTSQHLLGKLHHFFLLVRKLLLPEFLPLQYILFYLQVNQMIV